MKRLFAVVLAAALSFCAHADSLHDIVTKGATDRSVTVKIVDATTGVPSTDIVFNSTGIDLWYRREGAASVDVTEVTLAALTTAHTDGGFLHVNDGVYRLDLPDAAFATGANYVDFGGIVTGEIVIGGRVKLVNVNLEDAVRGGMTALPNANADAAGGLPISDAGGLDLDALASNVAAILVDTGTTLDDFVDDLESRLGTPSNFGSGTSTIAANLQDLADDGTATFDRATDSQQAIRDRGDAAWDTATGFSTHSAADVWTSGTRTLTAGTNIVLAKGTGVTGFNDVSTAQVNAEVDTALADINLDHLLGTAASIPAVVAGTYFDQLIDDGTAAYDRTTDSMQALRDRLDSQIAEVISSIGRRTTITVTDQDTFTLAAGATFDNAYLGWAVKINDAGSQDEWLGKIESYVGSSKTVELNRTSGFTIATGDTVTLYPAFLYEAVDTALVNCTVNTANFAGSTTTLACILTDKDGAAVTVASGDLTGLELVITSGAQAYERRYLFMTTWDGTNSELQITLDRALPATVADAVTAIIR